MVSEKLKQAVTLIKAGNKPAALPILKEVLQADPRNENAWLWLSSCVNELEQKKFCLQKALDINPDNPHALAAMKKLMEVSPQITPVNATVSKGKSDSNPTRLYWSLVFGVAGLLLFFCIVLSSLYLAQTGRIPAIAAGLPLFPSPTVTPSPTPTATITPSPSPTATETATPIPSPTITPSSIRGAEGIAQLDTLESYRMQGKMTMGGETEAVSITWNFSTEWVKASHALHTMMSIEDTGFGSDTMPSDQFPGATMETIVIDNTSWVKYEDDWIRIDSQQSQDQQGGMPGPTSDWQNLQLVGEETINGIPCIHYTVDEDTMKISGFGDDQDITTHTAGDIWVANQAGLPPVILRLKIQMRTSGLFSFQSMATSDPLMETVPEESQNEDIVYSYEYDVTDINTAIVIEPPETSAGL